VSQGREREERLWGGGFSKKGLTVKSTVMKIQGLLGTAAKGVEDHLRGTASKNSARKRIDQGGISLPRDCKIWVKRSQENARESMNQREVHLIPEIPEETVS